MAPRRLWPPVLALAAARAIAPRRLWPPVLALAAALALPAAALAGTVTREGDTLTYQADPTAGAKESVGVRLVGADEVIRSETGFSSAPDACTQDDTEVSCPPAPALVIRLLGFDDSTFIEG